MALVYVVGHLQHRYAEGERWARLSASVLRRLGPGHDLISAWRANNLAAVYMSEGKLDQALTALLEATALKRRALGPDHFDVAMSLGNTAIVRFALGHVDEAIAENDQALAILRKSLGPDHPAVAGCLASGAEFLNARGRWSEASLMAEQALAIFGRELEGDHPFLAAPLTALGWSWVRRGSSARAISSLERALAIREARDPDPAGLGDTRFALGSALGEDRSTRDRAISLVEQSRADYGHVPGAGSRIAEIEAWLSAHPSTLPSARTSHHGAEVAASERSAISAR